MPQARPATAPRPRREWGELALAAVSAALLISAGLALAPCLHLRMPNTAGEESALLGVWAVSRHQPLYTSDNARVAIYGPAYYALLGLPARLFAPAPDSLQTFARAISLLSATLAAVILAVAAARAAGRPAAGLVALLPLGLLPLDALRFLVSARPDAPALLLSLLGVALLLRARPRWILAAACFVLAIGCKPTALAAPAASIAALFAIRQTGPALRLASAVVAGVAVAVGLLAITTGGAFLQNLTAAGQAPRAFTYFTALFAAHPAWWILSGLAAALALLTFRTHRPTPHGPPSQHATPPTRLLPPFYALVSLLAAALFSTRQGGDVNYLLEPAAALGLWLALALRPVTAHVHQVGRYALCAGLLIAAFWIDPAGRVAQARRAAAEDAAFAPVRAELLDWFRTLPAPVLSLETWLSYAAGVDGGLVDRIAYTSSALGDSGRESGLLRRLAPPHYESVVLYRPLEEAGRLIYQDIPYATPALRRALAEHYHRGPERFGWVAYHPRR